jgi:uncharacterized protein (UPF0276 family)
LLGERLRRQGEPRADCCGRGRSPCRAHSFERGDRGERPGTRRLGRAPRARCPGGPGEAGTEADREEGRPAQGGQRRSQLRRRHVLGQREKALVSCGARPIHGVGLGLRWDFLDEFVERTVALERLGAHALELDFVEVSPENYMKRGGSQPAALDWIAERYPVVTHGLTMSLGGSDDLDDEVERAYFADLRSMLQRLRTPWHSDHLCLGAVDGRKLHDLLPVSFKKESVRRVADRIRRARDAIGLPLAIENVSYYWHPGRAEMSESAFLAEVCAAADCGLLLDVNNAYVNAVNHELDVDAWMREAPLDRVVQIHVAGHEWFDVSDSGGLGDARPPFAPGAMIIDTHGAPVADPVLALLERVLERTGPVPVLLERDQNVPTLDGLLAEVRRLQELHRRFEA